MATEPEPIKPLDLAAYTRAIDKNVDDLSPVNAYEMWLKGYEALASTGFIDPTEKARAGIDQALATRRIYKNGLLMGAGVTLLAAVVAGVALPS